MNPLYRQSSYLLTAPRVNLAPADEGYEVAFAGRSNAGKSSAINAITSQKSLARTSKTPGRTQQLIFFKIDPSRRFVDLPGYGFAKVPTNVQNKWKKTMENYFKKRMSLRGVFLIMDVRQPLTAYDQTMISWCNHCQLPLHIVLTKADKLKFGARKSTMMEVSKKIKSDQPNTSIQLFSALKKTGIDEAHLILDDWFEVANR